MIKYSVLNYGKGNCYDTTKWATVDNVLAALVIWNVYVIDNVFKFKKHTKIVYMIVLS